MTQNQPQKGPQVLFDNGKAREFVYGGTFDPIHNGHLAMIEQMKNLDASINIRVIPCAVPALKDLPGTSFQQRCEMLKLALEQFSGITIDTREAKRDGASYTIDTLEDLKKERPEKSLILVMGADSVKEIHKWHRWESFNSLCHLLIFNRPGVDNSTINQAVESSGVKPVEDFKTLEKFIAGSAFYAKMPEKQESSTEIRESSLQSGTASYMLPESVIEYIRKNRLYTGENS